MLNTFLVILKGVWSVIEYPIYLLGGLFILFYFLIILNLIIFRFKGKKLKKGHYIRQKKKSLFRRIFIDLPNRYAKDLLERDPDFFKFQGLIIYEGRQGSGKTSTMIHDAIEILNSYPLAKCISNCGFTKENEPLTDWHKLCTYKNGIYGVIAILDELQNWFGSNLSRNFPPEMLEVITQNRKNRRVIFGTAQNFYLLAKPIRSQSTEVRQCLTLLGCLTIVRRREPLLDSEGNVVKWKNKGFYFYVHDDELRNSYDTYKVIESLSASGFQEQKIENNITILSSSIKH